MVRCFFLTRRNDGRRRTENGIIVPINDEGNETIRFLTFVETEVQLKSRVGIVSNENSVELDLIDTTGLSNSINSLVTSTCMRGFIVVVGLLSQRDDFFKIAVDVCAHDVI